MADNETGSATGAVVDTRREVLAAALAEKVSATETETPAAPVKAEAPATETAAEAAARARDEKGRFAKAEQAKAEQAAKIIAPDATVETTPVEPPKPSRKYPSSWKKDYEPVYQELAANEKFKGILDEVERRESDFHSGIKRYDEDAKFAQTIRKSIAPFEATIRSLNIPAEQAIAGLLASDHALRYGSPAQKADAARKLFQAYGLDQSMLGEQQQAVDPNVQYLQQQLAETRSQLQQIQQNFQQQTSAQVEAELESFKKDKPYFDEVRTKMGQLYQAGVVSSLQEAYEHAIYANPAIREKLLAEQQAKAEAERKAKAQQAVTQAKSAAVQVKGAPPGASQGKQSKPKDRREALREAMNAVS